MSASTVNRRNESVPPVRMFGSHAFLVPFSSLADQFRFPSR